MAESKRKSTVSTYLLLFVLALVFAAALVLLLPVYRSYQKKKSELGTLTGQLNDKRDESARLKNDVADLQDSQVRYNQAKLGRISAVTDLALAVYDFEYATAEGTFRVALGGQ